MYNRISYIYILLSLAAHLALMFGVVALPSPSHKAAAARRLNPNEEIKVKLFTAPWDNPALAEKKEAPKVDEKKEVFLPEKKYLDFSDIPAGKAPEKALVYGKVSTEARNDFYRKKADKAQQSKTVAALPSRRVKKLLVRKPTPSLDARRPRELSRPAKQLPPLRPEREPARPLSKPEDARISGELESRAPKGSVRQPTPRLEGREYRDIQRPQKQEVIKKRSIYARLEPAPGERGRHEERSRLRSEPPPDIREKVREPRLLEKNVKGSNTRRGKVAPEVRPKRPEASASRKLGLEIGGSPDLWEMIGPSLARLEQVPDIPTLEFGEHSSIKNSDEDASNENKAKVVSLDTQELKYVSYFWHLKQKISNVWSYPSEAVRLGMEGTAVIRISLLRTGELEKIQLVRSSGFSMLDEEARDAIVTAGPFHAFPEQIKDQKLIIEGYFRYLGGFWNVGGR
jgi:protein TonB